MAQQPLLQDLTQTHHIR